MGCRVSAVTGNHGPGFGPGRRTGEGTKAVRAWIVWSTGLLAYIVAVLDRTTLGVSGLDAASRFSASPGVLSTFVVLQVVVYASAQIPAGLLLDRFGSKVMILSGGALMVVGQLALAFTESLPAAIGARAVVGLGDAFTFISVLRLVPHWFSPPDSAGDPVDRHLRANSGRCCPRSRS